MPGGEGSKRSTTSISQGLVESLLNRTMQSDRAPAPLLLDLQGTKRLLLRGGGPAATLQAGDGSCDGLQPSDGTESSPQHNPFRSVFGVPAG